MVSISIDKKVGVCIMFKPREIVIDFNQDEKDVVTHICEALTNDAYNHIEGGKEDELVPPPPPPPPYSDNRFNLNHHHQVGT